MPETAPPAKPFQYAGPKDTGRAESLCRSAAEKPDPEYAAQLFFLALLANPEHAPAFTGILERAAAAAAEKRRLIVRIGDSLAGAPADPFIKALGAYCATPTPDAALAVAAEAARAGLFPYAVILCGNVLQQARDGSATLRPASLVRLIDLFESCEALDQAVIAAQVAIRIFPTDASFRDREKKLLANQYLQTTRIEEIDSFTQLLQDRKSQDALHRPSSDHNARLDELEQRYAQHHRLEDFRELVRALRESSAARREAALPALEDGLDRFGEREMRWFLREVQIERGQRELSIHKAQLDQEPGNAALEREHQQLRQEVLREQIDHLYEVVSALPPSPERQKRGLELAGRLLDAGRYEEAIKQAQDVKRRAEIRLDAWLIMAKAFVQLGLTPEATECFQSILGELGSNSQTAPRQVLDARYSYAQFLLAEAARKRDGTLARQARKLCSDIMIEDIDYRDVRKLSAQADALMAK